MKKMVCILLSALMLLSLCGIALAADEPVTLHFWMWDDAQQPAIKAMCDAYTKLHPNVKFEISCQPAVDSLNSKIQATVGTDAAPEIFFINYNLAKEYIPMGFIQDLTEYKIDQSELAPGIVNAYTVDGKVYAVAKDTDSFAVFYNKELFDKAGVPYPKDDWTIDEFIETAKKLTKDDIIGFTGSTSDRVWYNFIYANGAKLFDEKGEKCIVDTPEAEEVVQKLMDLQKDGGMFDAKKLSDIGDTGAFTSGKAAMTINGSWMISQYAEALGDKLGIAELPSGKGGKFSTNHGIGYATTKNNKHMDETIDFLKFLATYDAQVLQKKVVIPANLKCAEEWEKEYPNLNLTPFKKALEYGVPYLTNKNATAARTAFQDTLANLRAGQYKDAKEFLKAAQEAVNDAIEG